MRGVEIPKAGGGVRQLGIATVVDRLVQQAILQVLDPILDPTFSDASFGFRPGRSAHPASAGFAAPSTMWGRRSTRSSWTSTWRSFSTG